MWQGNSPGLRRQRESGARRHRLEPTVPLLLALRRLFFRRQGHLISETFQTFDQIASELLGFEFVEVVGAEILVFHRFLEQMIDDAQQCMAHRPGHASFLGVGPSVDSACPGSCLWYDWQPMLPPSRLANQRLPFVVRLRIRLPADSSLPGLIPAQELRWFSLGKRLMSEPISATMFSIVKRFIPGIASSRITCSVVKKGRRQPSILSLNASIWPSKNCNWFSRLRIMNV